MRVVHQKDMALAHQVPKFDHEDRIVVLRSQGEHHVDLLHEICDIIHESKLDVRERASDRRWGVGVGEGEVRVRVGRERARLGQTLRRQPQRFGRPRHLRAARLSGPSREELGSPTCSHPASYHPHPPLQVVHAEMDTNSKGVEEHVLYVSRTDDRPTTREQRTELRTKVQELCRSHPNPSPNPTVRILALTLTLILTLPFAS